MVVFINGKARKSEYRKFKIKEAEGKPDDFKSMQEVIKRRYSRLIKDNKDLPDLIIVDGGKGQLSSAKEILDELGLFEQNIVSLAKRLEEVFIPNRKTSVIFPTSSKSLFFFQQIRDEAHRFAITYHRKLREKSSLKSALDDIEGIGIKKKQILLEYFKDFKGVMTANRSELERVLGKATGYKVYNYLHK